MAEAPAPYETTLTEAIKLAEQLLKSGCEVGGILHDMLKNKSVKAYTANIGSIPAGTKLWIALGDVDDAASISIEGFGREIGYGKSVGEYYTTLSAGRGAVVVSNTNSGGHHYSFHAIVQNHGTKHKYVDYHVDNDDNWDYNITRIYIYTYNQ